MPRLAGERARTVAQAFAIVENRSLDELSSSGRRSRTSSPIRTTTSFN
jgi:hypothetical protein